MEITATTTIVRLEVSGLWASAIRLETATVEVMAVVGVDMTEWATTTTGSVQGTGVRFASTLDELACYNPGLAEATMDALEAPLHW